MGNSQSVDEFSKVGYRVRGVQPRSRGSAANLLPFLIYLWLRMAFPQSLRQAGPGPAKGIWESSVDYLRGTIETAITCIAAVVLLFPEQRFVAPPSIELAENATFHSSATIATTAPFAISTHSAQSQPLSQDDIISVNADGIFGIGKRYLTRN
ncbi:unnamed protein product [Sphagnum jensenii]|uniref:Uncharacterized protein n=2 Tax=Sphagnum jensenii TaxID=128206 RepID=A0ABP0VKM0_9BRYO